jgi:hypothetical protein
MSSEPAKTEQPQEEKKGMTPGNIVLLIFGIILILGGGYYYFFRMRQHSAAPVAASPSQGGVDLSRATLDAAGTAQDLNMLNNFSYYF